MKKVVLICMVMLCVTNMALSKIYAYDTFDYTPGPIIGNSSPTLGFTGAWGTGGGIQQCTVEPASLVYGGASTAFQNTSGSFKVTIPVWDGSRAGRFLDTDPNGPFADYINNKGTIGKPGQSIYISFLMKSSHTSPFFAFELKRGELGDNGGILYIGNDIGGTQLQVCAYRNRNQDPSNIGKQLNWLGAATTNTELYVVRIDFGAASDNVTVYRNPALNAEPTQSPDLVNAGLLDFDAISMAAWVDPAGRYAQFDELCIASSYADAVRFYLRPEMAASPTPANGAGDIDVTPGVALAWQAGQGVAPTAYNVYFSSDLNAILTGDASAFLGTTTTPAMTVNTLQTDSTYYWAVNQVIPDANDILGQVWMFETAKTLPVVQGQPASQQVFAGQTASFTFDVESVSQPYYQWFDAAGQLTEGGSFSGTQSQTLVITDAQVMHEGGYYCKVTNSAGTITSSTAGLLIKRVVGYWALDQSADPNTAFQDLSDSANHLKAVYTVPSQFEWTAGIDGTPGKALVFDGGFALGTQKEDGTMNDIPVGNGAYTMIVWIRAAYSDGGLLGWGNYGNNNQCNALNLNADPYWVRNYWWDVDFHASRGINLVDENWHQVIAAYDGDIRTIYIDGLRAGSDNPIPHNVQSSVNFLIGKTNTLNVNGEFYRGAMDEVRVYNYALDPIDVAKSYTDIMGGQLCVVRPAYDLTGDCVVDMADFALFASQWLECGLVPGCLD
ncbi:MAG: immunoglobulin domain-containing protein [Sedimentisphaerales bacterium]|nr:immunoglobulin domain-containing protein [Sedimentisphaerales bacterium]